MKKNIHVIPFIGILTLLLSCCSFNFKDIINGSYSGDPNDYYWTHGFRTWLEKSAIVGLDDNYNPVVEILTNTLGVPPIIVGNKIVIPELYLPDNDTWSNRIHILDYNFNLEKTLEIECLDMAHTYFVISDSLVYLSASTIYNNKPGVKASIIDISTYEIWEYWINFCDHPPKANAGLYNNTLYISDGPEGGAYNQYSVNGADARMLMIDLKTKKSSETQLFHAEHPKDEADIVIDTNFLYILFNFDHVIEKWDLDTGTKLITVNLDNEAGLIQMPLRNTICREIWDYGDNLCIVYFGYQTEDLADRILSYIVISKSDLQYQYTSDFSDKISGAPFLDRIKGNIAYISSNGGIIDISTGNVIRQGGTYNRLE